MTMCPQCGYERKEADNIISADECPKCGIIYKKWKEASPEKDADYTQETDLKTSAPIIAPSSVPTDFGGKKINKVITVLVSAAILIIGGHYLLNTLLDGKFLQEKSKINDVVQSDSSPGANMNQPYSKTDINSGELKQPFAAQKNIPEKESMSAADLFRKNSRSVIIVKTQTGMGSGFFIDTKGHIVTNKHVLTDLTRAEIKTVGGNIYKLGRIIIEDAGGDLVIASTEAPASESIPVNVTSKLPEVGEKVIVIGNPQRLEQTLSDGIVSAIRRNQSGVNFIQVTAPISPGSSGGPLLNMYGEVIGVATFQSRQGQNLNFCIAAERIVAMQNGNVLNAGTTTAIQKPLYCYADDQGALHFVDWRTGVQVLRPDGSLDRGGFEKYALEIIGGNPLAIDPAREATNAVNDNKEEMFKAAFPQKSFNDPNLTSYEQQWWARRQQQFYNEAHNKAVFRKYAAVTKYNYMMRQFDSYSSNYNPLK